MRDTKALQMARANEPDPYRRRFTFPKWNRTVTVTDEPILFRRLPEFLGWSKDKHQRTALDYIAYARAYETTAHGLIKHGETVYGDHGPLIAGGFREHWPEALKDAIRVHSHGATGFRDKALAHWRACGRRIETYRALLEVRP